MNQKISNLVQAIAMGGLGSLDTITQEIQRLEHDKVKLTELSSRKPSQERIININS